MHGKLFLSLHAAERGFDVILGHKGKISNCLGIMPRGVYLYFGIVQNYVDTLKKSSSQGHRCVSFDEEGLAIYDTDYYLRYRISPDALQLIDVFYCWGDHQSNIVVSEHPWAKDKLIVTGSPRIDILRDEVKDFFTEDVKALKSEFGDFILINTNFGSTNHYYGQEYYFDSLKNKKMILNQEDETFHRGRLDHQRRVLQSFKKMLREVSVAFPDHNIVLRPHPSENLKFWEDISRDLPNVRIIHRGNVIPWLMAANALVHNGCTTAIEAYVLGTPAFAYSEVKSAKYEIFLPNALSIEVSSTEALVDNMTEYVNGKSRGFKDPAKDDLLKENIAAIDGDFASERILNSIELVSDKFVVNETPLFVKSKYIMSWVFSMMIDIKRKFSREQSYTQQKFDGLTVEEMKSLIAAFGRKTGSFSSIEVSPMGRDMFHIHSKDYTKPEE